GIRFHQVTGMLENDALAWKEIGDWIAAARVANIMFYNRLGCMGHYYSGMLDIYSDLTQHYAHFGGQIELLEIEQLVSLRNEVTGGQIHDQLAVFRENFDIQPDCDHENLVNAAVTSVALRKLVDEFNLGSFTYYYKGSGNEANENAI